MGVFVVLFFSQRWICGSKSAGKQQRVIHEGDRMAPS